MSLRTVDTLKTYYLDDYKTYPCDQKIELEDVWIGLKVEPEKGIILDIKWWTPDTTSTLATALENLADNYIGLPYSDSVQIEFEKTCSGS